MSAAGAHPAVTVLGLGRVGLALAECFAAAGVTLTVWNRSPGRARALEGRAAVAPDPGAACTAGELIVAALGDYGAALEVLDEAEAGGALAGRTLVQLTSGTPSDARTLDAWARMHGLAYLDAALIARARDIGTQDALMLYAGEEAVWERSRDTLALLGGRSRYCGEAVGAAAILQCAVLGYFYGAAHAMLQGAALCDAEGLALSEYFFLVKALGGRLTATADTAREMIPRERYAGPDTPLTTHLAALRQVQRATHDLETDTRLVDAMVHALRKAVGAGHGEDELAALFETLRRG